MAFRPRRWLVLFFTRPIHLSDFSALAHRLKPKPREKAAPEPVVPTVIATVPSSEPIELRRARPSPVRAPGGVKLATPRKDAGPSVVPSMFHRELEIGVSEQPIDTLPAELRDELQRPSTGRLQGSLRDG